MTPNLISIIIPSYNKSRFIVDTVESVVAQSDVNWELIIVDDCSTDGSPELLRSKYADNPQINLILQKENKGANYCRNLGMNASRGDYIMFLDADDLLEPFCIEQRRTVSSKHNDQDILVFSMGVFYKNVGDASESMHWVPKENGKWLDLFLKHQLPWQTMQPLWKRDYIQEIGGFNEIYRRLQDVELHTRALIGGGKVKTFPEQKPDVFFRIGDDRIELNTYHFFKKMTEAAVQFYKEFYPKLDKREQQLLTGTLLEPLSMICFQRRKGNLSDEEFDKLSNMLINCCVEENRKKKLKKYIKLDKASPLHPKGLKALFKKMLNL